MFNLLVWLYYLGVGVVGNLCIPSRFRSDQYQGMVVARTLLVLSCAWRKSHYVANREEKRKTHGLLHLSLYGASVDSATVLLRTGETSALLVGAPRRPRTPRRCHNASGHDAFVMELSRFRCPSPHGVQLRYGAQHCHQVQWGWSYMALPSPTGVSGLQSGEIIMLGGRARAFCYVPVALAGRASAVELDTVGAGGSLYLIEVRYCVLRCHSRSVRTPCALHRALKSAT